MAGPEPRITHWQAVGCGNSKHQARLHQAHVMPAAYDCESCMHKPCMLAHALVLYSVHLPSQRYAWVHDNSAQTKLNTEMSWLHLCPSTAG